MSIKNIELKLKKIDISNIKEICKKMKVKCTGKNKTELIKELMLPFKMKYRMKRKRGSVTNNTKCHNDNDLQLNEFVEGKYVNLGRYCVSLEDISGMVDNILTLKPSEVGENAFRRTLANPYTNNSITPKNIRDIREMLQRNNENELLRRFDISIRERNFSEQVFLSNDYESDDDFDDSDDSDEETDIEEEIEQISTEAEALEYARTKPTSEVFVELIHKFPNIESQLEAIVFD
jgi:hypothetical protein